MGLRHRSRVFLLASDVCWQIRSSSGLGRERLAKVRLHIRAVSPSPVFVARPPPAFHGLFANHRQSSRSGLRGPPHGETPSHPHHRPHLYPPPSPPPPPPPPAHP